MPALQRSAPQAAVALAEPRLLGVAAVPLLSALLTLALVIAVVLFAIGGWVGGLVMLAVGLGLLGLLVGAVRRGADSPAGSALLAAVERVSAGVRVAGVTASAWLGATVRVANIRGRQLRLRADLRHRLTPLGEAVHRGEDARASEIDAEAHRVERELQDCERELRKILGGARLQIERERARGAPTEELSLAHREAGGG
jgi:hypothetical protein